MRNQILDTRDLQKRLDELTDERDDLQETIDDEDTADEDREQAREDLAAWLEENGEELKELEAMAEEIPEWRYGETLVPEDRWVDYVQELCEECGYISKDFPGWIEIDWDKTADNVAMDYSTIDYQGTTYYYRS